ncbi:MAG TPA: SDR family oxidoreductase [Pseudonocardiaceae bacterium]|jgi:NADP-dependent 3-hydroxy acid dehydrogenase YdfG|nr:SDR family oxidoreductase [Pseudonocardiaceae bacterium]
MSADLPRPRALVTGASGGIGAATARALAPTHDVWLGGRDQTALAALAAELPGARPWPVDLTDTTALYSATAGIDTLDVLVHCAGVAEIAPLPATSADVWRRTLEVNVIAVAELTRLLLPALRATRGRVVLVNSGQGKRARAGWGAYAASKFALAAYADVLRAEEESAGLRITSVFPGRTDTDMQRGVRAAEFGEYDPSRYLRPESVADSIRFVVTGPPDAAVPELVIIPAV